MLNIENAKKLKLLGTFNISISLKNSAGATSNYTQVITLKDIQTSLFEGNFNGSNNGGERKNVTAYIDRITVYGEMTIKFNASMNTLFNFSHFNQSIVDIYINPTVIPEARRNFSYPSLNISSWELKNFTAYDGLSIMLLQINFSEPS